MANTGKLMPNLDQKSTKVLNLTVLQRIDPSVVEIIFTAAHVTFYEFNIDSSQWSRKDVEGSFFVVKRNTQPRFQFIVMNRRNTDNLVENLLGDFEYEVQLPYLLYRNASQEVNGIWFYNPSECEEVANLFNRILNAYSKVPTKSKVSSAKSDFEELEDFSRIAIMDGPLETSSSINSNVSDSQDDPSFVNFFSTAMNNRGTPKPSVSGKPYHSSATVTSTSRPQPIDIPILPAAQIPSPLCSPNPTISTLDIPETNIALSRSTDLIKPSSFFGPLPSSPSPPTLPPLSPSVPNSPPINAPLSLPPLSPSVPNSPPINAHVYLQRPYGAPLLQPFPPPTPPPLLTPSSVPQSSYGTVISREKVREALQILVQDNQFIDMVYRAMMNAHQSS